MVINWPAIKLLCCMACGQKLEVWWRASNVLTAAYNASKESLCRLVSGERNPQPANLSRVPNEASLGRGEGARALRQLLQKPHFYAFHTKTLLNDHSRAGNKHLKVFQQTPYCLNPSSECNFLGFVYSARDYDITYKRFSWARLCVFLASLRSSVAKEGSLRRVKFSEEETSQHSSICVQFLAHCFCDPSHTHNLTSVNAYNWSMRTSTYMSTFLSGSNKRWQQVEQKLCFFPFSLGLKVLFYGRFRKIRRWKPWWTFKLGRRTLRVRRAGRYQVKVQNVWFFLRRKKGRWSAKFKGRSYRVVTRGSNFFLRKNRRLIPLIYFRIHFRGAWRPLRFRKKKMLIRYKRQWRKMRSKFVYRVRVKGRYYTALRKGNMFSIRNHGRWRGWTPAYRRKWSGMTVMVCTAW